MYIYEMPDIKEVIKQIIEKDNFSVEELQRKISGFFDNIDNDFKMKIFGKIAKEIGYDGPSDQILTYFYDLILKSNEHEENQLGVRVLAEEFANCSDHQGS